MTVEIRTQPQPRTHTRRSPGRPRTVVATASIPKGDHRAQAAPERVSSTIPPIVTVFRLEDGIHHTRCTSRIDFVGVRGGIEFDFYCLACCEHVTLPEGALPRIPEGQPVGG